MGGINHRKWVVYYCYTHNTKIPYSQPPFDIFHLRTSNPPRGSSVQEYPAVLSGVNFLNIISSRHSRARPWRTPFKTSSHSIWWYAYPSEKYDVVPIYGKIKNVPKHQATPLLTLLEATHHCVHRDRVDFALAVDHVSLAMFRHCTTS